MRTKNAMRLFGLLAVLTVLAVLPGLALATGGGTVEAITEEGTVRAVADGYQVTFNYTVLDYDASQNRWFVGARVISPSLTEAQLNAAQYWSTGNEGVKTNFKDRVDGKNGDLYHISFWFGIDPDTVDRALSSSGYVSYSYSFDWDGNGTQDQAIKFFINAKNITLNKDGKIYFKNTGGTTVYRNGNPILADYTGVDEALALIPPDLSLYTDESVKPVTSARDKVKRGKLINEQAIVDRYAKNIVKAVNGLTPKQADYTGVDEALALIPSDLSPYTEESVKALTNARNAVIPGKRIDEQDIVDGYAAAIKKAVNALKFKPVNLPQTGDHSDLALWASLLALACAGMAAAGLRGRKRNQEH